MTNVFLSSETEYNELNDPRQQISTESIWEPDSIGTMTKVFNHTLLKIVLDSFLKWEFLCISFS